MLALLEVREVWKARRSADSTKGIAMVQITVEHSEEREDPPNTPHQGVMPPTLSKQFFRCALTAKAICTGPLANLELPTVEHLSEAIAATVNQRINTPPELQHGQWLTDTMMAAVVEMQQHHPEPTLMQGIRRAGLPNHHPAGCGFNKISSPDGSTPSPAEAPADLEQDPEDDNLVKKGEGARRGREMMTVEAILYARAGNEVYQRGAMRDAAEKESLMIYEQQAEEMEASGECKKYQNTEVAHQFSAEGAQRLRRLFDTKEQDTRPVIHIVGMAAVGEELAAAGDLNSFRTKRDGRLMCKFQWYRAATELVPQGTAEAAMSFVPISHARKPVYKPRKEDVGHMLKVEVIPQLEQADGSIPRRKLYAISGPVTPTISAAKAIQESADEVSSRFAALHTLDASATPGSSGNAARELVESFSPCTVGSVADGVTPSASGAGDGRVSMQAELERWQERASRLVSEKLAAQQEAHAARMKVAELTARETRWAERYEAWQHDLQKQLTEVGRSVWEGERARLEEQVAALNTQLASERAKVSQVTQDMLGRQTVLDKALKEVEDQRAALREEKQALDAMHASASAMQAQHDAAQRGVSELRAELHAEREKLREELHMAAQERQQAESEARAAQSRYAETVHGAAEAAREAVRRSAAADVTNMKAAAAEELSRERAAFQEEIAATQKQLMSERSTLNAERQVLEKETEAARNALQAERAQLYVTSDSVKRSAAAAREEADAAMLAVQRKQEEVQRERAILEAERKEVQALAERLAVEMEEHSAASRKVSCQLNDVEHERARMLRDVSDMRDALEAERQRFHDRLYEERAELQQMADAAHSALEAAEEDFARRRAEMEDEVANAKAEAAAAKQATKAEQAAALQEAELQRAIVQAEHKLVQEERQEMEQLRRQLEEEREELSAIEDSQRRALAANMAEAHLSTDSLRRQQADLTTQHKALETERAELEQQLGALRHERAALGEVNTDLAADVAALQAKLQMAEREHQQALGSREAASQRHAELEKMYQQRVAELNRERSGWQRQLEESEAARAQLADDCDKLEAELSSSAETIISLQGQIKAWEARWTEEQSAWAHERNMNQRRLDNLMIDRCEDAKVGMSLEAQAAVRDARAQALKEELQAAHREINSLHRQKEMLEQLMARQTPSTQAHSRTSSGDSAPRQEASPSIAASTAQQDSSQAISMHGPLGDASPGAPTAMVRLRHLEAGEGGMTLMHHRSSPYEASPGAASSSVPIAPRQWQLIPADTPASHVSAVSSSAAFVHGAEAAALARVLALRRRPADAASQDEPPAALPAANSAGSAQDGDCGRSCELSVSGDAREAEDSARSRLMALQAQEPSAPAPAHPPPSVRGPGGVSGARSEFEAHGTGPGSGEVLQLRAALGQLEREKGETGRFLVQVAAEWEAAKAKYEATESLRAVQAKRYQDLEAKLARDRKELLEELGKLRVREQALQQQVSSLQGAGQQWAEKGEKWAAERKRLKAQVKELQVASKAGAERSAAEKEHMTSLQGEMAAWRAHEDKWEERRRKWQLKKDNLRALVSSLQAEVSDIQAQRDALASDKQSVTEEREGMARAIQALEEELVAVKHAAATESHDLKERLQEVQSALLEEATKASTAQMELLELTSAGSHHAPEPAAADRLRLLQAAVVELGEMRLGVADDLRLLHEMLGTGFWRVLQAVAEGTAGGMLDSLSLDCGQPGDDGAGGGPASPSQRGGEASGGATFAGDVSRISEQQAGGNDTRAEGLGAYLNAALQHMLVEDAPHMGNHASENAAAADMPAQIAGSVPTWQYLLAKYSGQSTVWGPAAQVILPDDATTHSKNALNLRHRWTHDRAQDGEWRAPESSTVYSKGSSTRSEPQRSERRSAERSHTPPHTRPEAELQASPPLSPIAVMFPSPKFPQQAATGRTG
eukprot:jgi/Tetstr1/458093/TSEL_044600.t1